MVNEQRVLNDFLRLAAIPSPSLREKDLADVLESDLRALGFDVRRDNAGEIINGDAGNLVATKKGAVLDAIPIAFSAHMDTVDPWEGWSCTVEDGAVRASGGAVLGADDKAGIASLLEALRVVSEDNIPHGDIQIIFSICEEMALKGSRNLDMSLVTSSYVFVYDMTPPVGVITIAGPSKDEISIKVYGKSAHSVESREGVNAVLAAANGISRMKLGYVDEETTSNIGLISGGTGVNSVPDYCELRGEARSRNPEKLDALVKHITEVFQTAAEELGARAEVEVERSYEGFRLSKSDEVVCLAAAAAKRIGIEPEYCEIGGGIDGNIFNARGIPAVAIGQGMLAPHSREERITISDLAKAAELAVAIIQEAASAPGKA